MANEILIGYNTRPLHAKFVEWLNRVLSETGSPFYDEILQIYLSVIFVQKHYVFMQELYDETGKNARFFVTVITTDSQNKILLIHNKDTGEPFLYNSADVDSLLHFNSFGVLVGFEESTTIQVYDKDGQNRGGVSIFFEESFGIKVPFMTYKEHGMQTALGKGFMDVPYGSRYSGTYMVGTQPMMDKPYFSVTNITTQDITMDIPIFPKVVARYVVPAGRSIRVVVTESTEYYFKTAQVLDAIVFVILDPNDPDYVDNIDYVFPIIFPMI